MAHAAQANVMLMTPDELLVYPLPEGKSELVRGELRVAEPAGAPHGRVSTNLVALLSWYLKGRDFGWVFADGVGYELIQLPLTVRCPDVSFVRAHRLPLDGVASGFLKLAPDLAVEVLSPSESASDLEETLADYRACGTPLLWVIDPVRRTVMIVAHDAPVCWLREGDTLLGGEVIPGFSCGVAELFEGLKTSSRQPHS